MGGSGGVRRGAWPLALAACIAAAGCGSGSTARIGDLGGRDDAVTRPDVPLDLPGDEGVDTAEARPEAIDEPGTEGPVDELPEVDDLPDTGCIPQCDGRVCGDDGCGGQCGYCPYGEICLEGLCKPFCSPDCTGKKCGDDGCGGDCGTCADNEECAPDFTCVLKGCVPQCAGRQCGPDGCGTSCGDCPDGQVCTKAGQCTEDTACHDVTATGQCIGAQLQWCDKGDPAHPEGILRKQDCDTASGLVCGFSQKSKKFECMIPEVCQPQCTGRQCGPDGCGKTCGECAAAETCSTGGKCGPPCGDVTETGICQGNTLVFCHQGIQVSYDCDSQSLVCIWNPEANTGKGAFDCMPY